ncbi:MAG TPA: VOC family protein [Acetobacteraceae bacterium]|jgi:PhnB protein|nr:VOC family protein [Acetobacteraceae bacterium]
MKLNAYLSFNGTCKQAFTFYAEVLHGQIPMMMTYADAPPSMPTTPATRDQVMHARLLVGDQVLMGSDTPGDCYKPVQGVHVTLNVETPAEAERLYNALVAGGTAQMPLQETFWALRFAMLSDKFGTPWMINCEKPMPAHA